MAIKAERTYSQYHLDVIDMVENHKTGYWEMACPPSMSRAQERAAQVFFNPIARGYQAEPVFGLHHESGHSVIPMVDEYDTLGAHIFIDKSGSTYGEALRSEGMKAYTLHATPDVEKGQLVDIIAGLDSPKKD